MKIGSKRSCDVLIIGGGSAGLRAAIEAHDAGANVLIISKVERGDPHTVTCKRWYQCSPWYYGPRGQLDDTRS